MSAPDPLFARYPLRGFRTDIALTGAVAPTLQTLWRAAQKQAVSVKADRGAAQDDFGLLGQRAQEGARGGRARAGRDHRQMAVGLRQQAARRRQPSW
jgi:acetolactate synthase-1/2/3 large subunit